MLSYLPFILSFSLPSLPPSFSPSFSPSLPLSLPPSLPPLLSLPPSLPPFFSPSLPPSFSPSLFLCSLWKCLAGQSSFAARSCVALMIDCLKFLKLVHSPTNSTTNFFDTYIVCTCAYLKNMVEKDDIHSACTVHVECVCCCCIY